MRNIVKRATAGAALGGSLFFTVGLGIANAAPNTANDGLVNLTLGSVPAIQDVDVTTAAQIAAAVCDVGVDSVTTTVQGVDANGAENVVCTATFGPVTISQNGPGASERAPGIAGNSPTTTPSTTTTTPTG